MMTYCGHASMVAEVLRVALLPNIPTDENIQGNHTFSNSLLFVE
jgi:hypothetical protein